jgi:hypothetical protein
VSPGSISRGLMRSRRKTSGNCTVAREDEVIVALLEAPLAGVSRLDAISYGSTGATPEDFYDIPFNAASSEVVLTPNTGQFA